MSKRTGIVERNGHVLEPDATIYIRFVCVECGRTERLPSAYKARCPEAADEATEDASEGVSA